jgi:hypothetical protein
MIFYEKTKIKVMKIPLSTIKSSRNENWSLVLNIVKKRIKKTF